MISGGATLQGTARYAARFGPAEEAGFYRDTVPGRMSSLGIGTYLGGMDERTDRNYVEAVETALASGINAIDTSLNYRLERSEHNVGAAIRAAIDAGTVQRDEFVVATKAGYLVPKCVPEGLGPDDVVAGIHSMAPLFLEDQLERSRKNLGLETVDIFYLHNPETQLGHLPADALYERFREAFQTLERFVADGRIGGYGAATWSAFRTSPDSGKGLSLARLLAIAEEVAGENHRFRYIQLPFNLAMPEALLSRYETLDGHPASALELALWHGMTVAASATLSQAKLAYGLPDVVGRWIAAESDAQRAIQFARSAPGVTVALVGMSRAAHVRDNLGVASFRPIPPDKFSEQFTALFR